MTDVEYKGAAIWRDIDLFFVKEEAVAKLKVFDIRRSIGLGIRI